jgi:hypothetical protein
MQSLSLSESIGKQSLSEFFEANGHINYQGNILNTPNLQLRLSVNQFRERVLNKKREFRHQAKSGDRTTILNIYQIPV